MVMQHGVTMTRHSENCASRILYLGKGQFQNLWCLLAPFTVLSSFFGTIFVPDLMTSTPNFASTSTMVLNVDQTPAPTNMPVKPVEIQDIQELNAQETKLIQNIPNKIPTPINVQNLSHELHGYDQHLASYLVNGFQFGFKLGCVGEPVHCVYKNHNSVYKNPAVVQEKLTKEFALGRISAPHMQLPFDNYVCSPLGLVPKKTPGEYRIIHDLSFPKNMSVNSHIPKSNSQVQYESIEHVIQLIKQFGPHSLMAKTDIEDGFRNIPIHPSDYHLLGFSWNGAYYFDKCLPMGASSSCQIFEKLSTALHWAMINKYNASGMSHLIDDFFFIGPPDSEKCFQDLSNFEILCKNIGIPIKKSKTVLPTTTLTIYGIEVDSVKMESRLPSDKLVKLKGALTSTSKRKKITLQDLQSLIGLLNFACSVVVPGRAFLRRLIDLTCNVDNPRHYIKLNSEARCDIKAWQDFIVNFNGKSIFLQEEWTASTKLNLYTDASGSLGYAAILGSQWFASSWLDEHKPYQIAIKELFPIVLALELWGHKLRNHKILFFSDNMAVVEIINKQSSKDKILMRLVRRLVLAGLKFNVLFKAKHIPGKSNVVADHLSRFKFQEAKAIAPWLNPQPTPLPSQMVFI